MIMGVVIYSPTYADHFHDRQELKESIISIKERYRLRESDEAIYNLMNISVAMAMLALLDDHNDTIDNKEALIDTFLIIESDEEGLTPEEFEKWTKKVIANQR